MNPRRLVFLILSSVSLVACPQTPSVTPSPNLDIYANFVGEWAGTVTQSENGVIVDTPVELKITESPKKDSMSFSYKYQTEFDVYSRVITLNAKTSKMISQYQNADKDVFKAEGLEKFAETGYGVFVSSKRRYASSGVAGTYPFYRCTFSLSPNTFAYQPEVSSDGKTFRPTSVFTFTRKTSTSTTLTPDESSRK